MKNILFICPILLCMTMHGQQHFSGINTSSRTGIINGTINPAEFVNVSSTYSIHVLGASVNVGNNKISISDLTGGEDFEDLIFSGNEDVDFNIDAEIVGPGIVYKKDKWAFAFTTRAFAKLNMSDVDVNIGDAIANAGLNSLFTSTTISNGSNQRLNGTTWGEVGLSAAHTFFTNEKHLINGGATLKLMFPGSYANFGAGQFQGTINNTLGDGTLTNTEANLNIAYSGNLGESFTDLNDYTQSLFGKLNGVAVDIGVNYQLKDNSGSGKYKINAGLSFRNLGGMTFKSPNNSETNYRLSIQDNESLNLSQFKDVASLEEVESILLESGFLDKTSNNRTDFKVSLPATFNAYADVRIIPDLFVTIFTQQRLKDNGENDQIYMENVTSLTPRYVYQNVEVFSPWAVNEISGISGGLGFRAYGFFIGSGSVITALLSDAKQADLYLGYGFQFN